MIIKDVKKVAIIAGAVAAATVAGTVSAVLIKKHKKAKDTDLEIDDEDFDDEDFDIEDDEEDFDIEDDEEDFDIEDDEEEFDIEDDVDAEGFEIQDDKVNKCTENKSDVSSTEDKPISCEDVKNALKHLGIKDEKFINNIVGVGEGVEKAAYNTAKVSKAVAVKTLKKVLKVLEAED